MKNLKLSRGSRKFLKQQAGADAQRLVDAIQNLRSTPHPPQSKKLTGEHSDYYRLRVGDFRIVYKIENKQLLIVIVVIARRNNVYRQLQRLK